MDSNTLDLLELTFADLIEPAMDVVLLVFWLHIGLKIVIYYHRTKHRAVY